MLLTLKASLSIGLILGEALQYTFPEFNGYFSNPIKTSIEHRELIGAITSIGGLILFYMITFELKELG